MDTAAAEIANNKILGWRLRMAAFIELTKPRIAFMLVLTSAAGFYLGTKGSFDFALFINAMIGILILAFGVATLNQWMERSTDALMARTKNRPLPSTRLTPTEALVFGLVQCSVSEIYLYFLVNPLTAGLGLVVIVGYVLLYTPLKTRTSASTAIGAIPGAMLFLWQFPHFLAIAWMYKEQYAKAGILMLPVVEPAGRITARQIVLFAIMLVPASLAPFFLGIAGIVYLVGATLLGLWFLYESIAMARSRTVAKARRLLMVSVLYLPLIFGLLVLDH